MNYFELYGIPVSFNMDEELVKKKYFELSKKFHPDFFVNESEEKQNEMLQLSTQNTKAFQTLSDFDRRMKYILELKDLVHEEERYELPPGFLMEMMAINEELMELKAEPDEKKITNLKSQIANLENELFDEVKNIIASYDDSKATGDELKKIKAYFYKKKYLLRIQQSLDTFAARR